MIKILVLILAGIVLDEVYRAGLIGLFFCAIGIHGRQIDGCWCGPYPPYAASGTPTEYIDLVVTTCYRCNRTTKIEQIVENSEGKAGKS